MAVLPSPRPPEADPRLQAALAAFNRGDAAAAAAGAGAVSAEHPDCGPAVTLTAVARHMTGDVAGAIAVLDAYLQRKPSDAEALYNRARMRRLAGDDDGAEADLAAARGHAPNDAETASNHGAVLLALGRPNAARAAYEDALRLQPGLAAHLWNFGVACAATGDREAARDAYDRTIAAAPTHADALHARGALAFEDGDRMTAGRLAERAVAAVPDHVDSWTLLGLVRNAVGDFAGAIAAHRSGLALAPENARLWSHLATDLRGTAALEAATDAARKAADLAPEDATVRVNLGVAHLMQGRVPEARRHLDAGEALAPDDTRMRSGAAFAMNYDAGLSPDDIGRRLAEIGAAIEAAVPVDPPRRAVDPEKRLTVGYVSPDFRTHSVATFFRTVLEAHDRTQVRPILYSLDPRFDDMSAALKAAAADWVDCRPLSDAALSDRIRADGVDILVDLAGHTDGNRIALFARKSAPVQATWLGWPASTGLTRIDARLTDARADPEGAADSWCTERLVRLPDCFHAFRPRRPAPDVAPPPSAAGAPIVFGSFNALPKLSDPTVELWARILEAVPGARLLMKAWGLDDRGTGDRVRARFASRGIAADRLDLIAFAPKATDHMGLYGRVDIGLDPTPYAGTTTTCEALWMGVPVVTLAGRGHAARVGVSLLDAVGLPELIAEDGDAYVRIAADLAADPARLATVRAGLRDRFVASPLGDGPRLARAIEAAYRDLWRTRCAADAEGAA